MAKSYDLEDYGPYSEGVFATLQLLDAVSFNHSYRVREISRDAENFFEHNDSTLSKAAFVHDIGKIYISTKILDKKGTLSQVEKNIIDLHPYISYQVLRELGVYEGICRIALYHHGINPPCLSFVENYDNKKIMHYAEMLRTIDSFEALTTDRSYRRGFPSKEAIRIMEGENFHDEKTLDFLKKRFC